MRETDAALPEWISPPGEIVSRILDAKRIDVEDFAKSIDLSVRDARGLLEGTTAIDQVLAARLARVLGSTSSFWMRCEQSYRDDVRRNLPGQVDDEVKAWLRRLPLK